MKKEVLSRLKFCFNKELNFSRLSSIISFYFCELHPRFDHLSSNILSLAFREANNGRYRIYITLICHSIIPRGEKIRRWRSVCFRIEKEKSYEKIR